MLARKNETIDAQRDFINNLKAEIQKLTLIIEVLKKTVL